MRRFSSKMEGCLAAKWLERGSEQVMSKLVIANQPNATLVPHPVYAHLRKIAPS